MVEITETAHDLLPRRLRSKLELNASRAPKTRPHQHHVTDASKLGNGKRIEAFSPQCLPEAVATRHFSPWVSFLVHLPLDDGALQVAGDLCVRGLLFVVTSSMFFRPSVYGLIITTVQAEGSYQRDWDGQRGLRD